MVLPSVDGGHVHIYTEGNSRVTHVLKVSRLEC